MRREWQAQQLSAFGSHGSYFLGQHTVRVDIFRAEEEEVKGDSSKASEARTRTELD